MSDPNPQSNGQVELVTSIGTWFGPVVGSIVGCLMTYALVACSKNPKKLSDPESSSFESLIQSLRVLREKVESMRTELDGVVASRDAQQKQINSIIAGLSNPTRQGDDETRLSNPALRGDDETRFSNSARRGDDET